MIFMNIRHELNECFMGPESLIKMFGYIICSAYKSHFMAACVNLVWSMPCLCEAHVSASSNGNFVSIFIVIQINVNKSTFHTTTHKVIRLLMCSELDVSTD